MKGALAAWGALLLLLAISVVATAPLAIALWLGMEPVVAVLVWLGVFGAILFTAVSWE